ncbi:Uncharacterised protein [Clostridioides difficile]|nr:Uncharacterised protein [Clostridioides difficile]
MRAFFVSPRLLSSLIPSKYLVNVDENSLIVSGGFFLILLDTYGFGETSSAFDTLLIIDTKHILKKSRISLSSILSMFFLIPDNFTIASSVNQWSKLLIPGSF